MTTLIVTITFLWCRPKFGRVYHARRTDKDATRWMALCGIDPRLWGKTREEVPKGSTTCSKCRDRLATLASKFNRLESAHAQEADRKTTWQTTEAVPVPEDSEHHTTGLVAIRPGLVVINGREVAVYPRIYNAVEYERIIDRYLGTTGHPATSWNGVPAVSVGSPNSGGDRGDQGDSQ